MSAVTRTPSDARRAGRRALGGLGATALAELRAALAAGASPGAALVAAAGREVPAGVLQPVARQLRAGQALGAVARDVATGDPAADLLVRSLAVAERTGAGSDVAVEQAVVAARDEADIERLLRARTLQARGTAALLGAIPVCVWLLLVAVDREALSFYTTPAGAATGGTAAALAAAGQWWSRRIVAAARRASLRADPLAPGRPARDWARAAAVAAPALVTGTVLAGPLVGLAAAAVAAAAGGRRAASADRGGNRQELPGGAAEAVELVTVGLSAGLGAPAAVAAVAPLAQPAARPVLADASRRLRNGWDVEAAFADGGLAALGATLAVSVRWGAPAAPALRQLAADLRVRRRAAVEEAAERTQLALVFPTTLLTLPAFVLGVVPPLLWTALA